MIRPSSDKSKNSLTAARIATVTTGLESLSLIVPNDPIRKVMIVLSPAIAFFLVIGLKHLYKRYTCKTTIALFLKHIEEAKEELKNLNLSSPRRHTLENDIVGLKKDIKLLEKRMIEVEFK